MHSSKKYDVRDKKGKFRKIIYKHPPIMYRRTIPKGMVRVKVGNIGYQIKFGSLLEFVYGIKQKPGQVGGWKHDRKPVLLVFYDNKDDGYIEGLNTNYLSGYYVNRLQSLLRIFPGIDGIKFYYVVKKTASFAVKKGYRKYIRSSLKNIYLYKHYGEDKKETLDSIKEE